MKSKIHCLKMSILAVVAPVHNSASNYTDVIFFGSNTPELIHGCVDNVINHDIVYNGSKSSATVTHGHEPI
jgi:hypothetical protein